MTLKQQSSSNEFKNQEVSYQDPLIEGIEQSVSKESVSEPSNDNPESNRTPTKKKTSDESVMASAVDSEANQVRASKSTRKANLKVRLENIQDCSADLSHVAEEDVKHQDEEIKQLTPPQKNLEFSFQNYVANQKLSQDL